MGRRASRDELHAELQALRARLAEAEQTLEAIAHDDVDALVVKTRSKGDAEVLTIGGAHVAYAHFYESMQEGALTVDDSGIVLHANRRMAELVGRDNLTGCSVFSFLGDENRLRTILQNLSTQAAQLEASLVTDDGSRVPVQVTASVLTMSGLRRIGVIVNVTDPGRWRAVGEPGGGARSPQPFEGVLEHLPTGTIVADAKTGTITYANHRAEEILGRSLMDPNCPVSQFDLTCWRRDGTIVEPDQMPFARALRGERVHRIELARPRPDGSLVQTRSTAVPIVDESGEIARVLLAIEDSTEEYMASVEREADERFRELFVGILGHDLRDPLNAIVVGAALLKRAARPEDTKVLQRISSAADRMTRMIEQILDFARSRVGTGIPLSRRQTSLEGVIHTVVEHLEASHPGRAVKLSFEASTTGEWDPDRLEQVVSNLVSNALSHGSPSEPVTLRVTGDALAAHITVHNRGEPIPSQALPFVFDPFRRAAVRGKNARGLGLGLYIAQQIVHAHGGTITVESGADGTSFTVVLPRTPPPAPSRVSLGN